MEKIEYILKCIGRGWTITPLLPNKKIPRGTWKDLSWQFSTEERVLGHWLDHPNDNYGIITGLSGLKVVDVDSGTKIKDGKTEVRRVEGKYIQEILEYPTLTVRTQSGGFHYYYDTDGDKKDRLGVVENIDIKADGYVVGPGSAVDGKEYKYQGGKTAPMPKFSFIPNEIPIVVKKTQSAPSFELEKVVKALAYIAPEEYDVWLKVGMAIKEAGGDISVWEDWSMSSEKYKAGDCGKKWDSFKGTGVGIGSVFHMAKQKGFKIEAPKIKLKKGKEPKVEDSGLPKKISEYKDLSWLGDGSRKYAYYETGIDWIDNNMHGIQKRTIITAPSNTGKTQLALQIAKSTSVLGKPVLYVDMEQPIRDLWMRVVTMGTDITKEDLIVRGQEIFKSYKYKDVMEINQRDADNIYWTDLAGLETIEDVEAHIDAWASQFEAEPLVIVDQISGLKRFTGQPTMYEQTQLIADWLRVGIKDKSWTAILLSPQNKASYNSKTEMAVSGSGELVYAVDCVFSLSKVIDPDTKEWDRERVGLNIAKTRAGKVHQYDYNLIRNSKDQFILNNQQNIHSIKP